MIRPVQFESQDRRMKQILAALNENGIKDIEEANKICEEAGLDPYLTCQETQGICFENAKWAYVVGCYRTEERLQERCRCCRSYRYRFAIVLYSGFCSR